MGNIKLFTVGGGGPLQPQRGPDGDFDLTAELEALKSELDAIESKYASKVSLFNYDVGDYAFNHLKTTEVDINDEPLGDYEDDFKPVILNEAVASSFAGPTNLDTDVLQPSSGPVNIDTNLVHPDVGPFNFNYINVLFGPLEGPLDETLVLYHLSPNTGPISFALDSTLLPIQGPAELDSRLLQPEDGPENSGIAYLPYEGPSALDTDVEPPSSAGPTNMGYVLLPTLSPTPLTVSIQEPQQATSNLSYGVLPLTGPQNIDWEIYRPVNGPTNFREAVPLPTTGPTNFASEVVAPSLGPDNIYFGHNDPLTVGPTNFVADLLLAPLEGPTFLEFKSTVFLWQGPEVYTAAVGVDVSYNIVDDIVTSAGYNRGALLIQPRIGHGRFSPYTNGNEWVRTYENAWWFHLPNDQYLRDTGDGEFTMPDELMSYAFRYQTNRVRWLQEGRLPQAYPFQWEAIDLDEPPSNGKVNSLRLPTRTWTEAINDPRSWMYPCDRELLGPAQSYDTGNQKWILDTSLIPKSSDYWDPPTTSALYPAEEVTGDICDVLHYIDPNFMSDDIYRIVDQWGVYKYPRWTYYYNTYTKGYQLFGNWGGGFVHYDYVESCYKFSNCKSLQTGENIKAKAIFTDKWGFCGMSRHYIETDKITPLYTNSAGPVWKGGRQQHLTSRLGTDNPPGSKITYFIGEDNLLYAVGDNGWGGFANGGWGESKYPTGYNFYKHDANWETENRAGSALTKNDFPHNRKPVPQVVGSSEYLNIEEVAIGEHHAIFRTAGGETYGLGRNVFGQQSTNHDGNQHVDNADLIVNTSLTKTTETNVAQVSCGPHHSVFTKNDGTVTIAGLTGYPQHPLINFDYLSDDFDAGLLTAYSSWDKTYLPYYEDPGYFYGVRGSWRLRMGKFNRSLRADVDPVSTAWSGTKWPNWITNLAGTGEQTYNEWGVSFGTANHRQTLGNLDEDPNIPTSPWELVPNQYLSRARTVLASDGSPFGGVHKSIGGMSCFWHEIGHQKDKTNGSGSLEEQWDEYILNPDESLSQEWYGTMRPRWANKHFTPNNFDGRTDYETYFFGPTTLFLKKDGTVWGVGCNGGGVLNINQESDFYQTPTQLVWPSGDPIENIIDLDMTSNEACLVDSAGRLFIIANYEIYQPVDSSGRYIQPGWSRVKMGGGVKSPDATITSSNPHKSTDYKFQSSVMVMDKNGVWATFGVNNRGNLGMEIEDGSNMSFETSPVYINLDRPTTGPSSLGFPKNDAIQVHTVGYYWPLEECLPSENDCARPQLAPSNYKWNTPDEGHRFDSQPGPSKYYLDFLFTDSEGKLIDPSEFNFIKMKGPDYWSNLVPDGNSGYYGAVLESPTVRDHMGNEINPADKFPEYSNNPKIFRAYFQWKIGSFRLGDGVGYSQRWILKPTMNMNNLLEVHSSHPTLGFDSTIKSRQLLNPHDYYYDHADTIIKEFRYTSGEVHKTITTQDQLDADYDNFIPSRHNKSNIIISGDPGETVTFDVVLLTTGPLDVNIGRLFDSYYTQRAWATPVSYTKVDNHTAILRLRTTLPSTPGTYYCNRVPAGISFQDMDPSKVPNGYPLRSNIPNSHWSNNGFANLLRLKCVYLKQNYSNFTKDTYFGCTMYVGQRTAYAPFNFKVQEIGYPPESKEVTSISAGSDFCSVLTKTNDLWCSGKGDLGQNGANLENRSLWLKALSDVSSHASGTHHQLAIVNGSLYATGKNTFAQLGNKGRDNLSTFTHITDLDGPSPITQVACGENHSAFLRANGTVWVMGSGTKGQYGDGNLSQGDRAPRRVAQDAVFVACGPNTTYYIDVDGNLYGTGDNNAYQLRTRSGSEPYEKYFKFLDGGVESVKGGKTCTIFKKLDRVLYAIGTNVNQMFGYTRGFEVQEPETINFDVDSYSVSDTCVAYIARNNLYLSGWFRLDGRDKNFKDRDSYVIRQKHDFTGNGEQYYMPHDESEHLHILEVLAADADFVELAEGAIFYKDLNKYLYAISGDHQGYNWLGFTDPGIYKGSQYTRTSNPKTGTNGKSKVIFG